jgi:hypothetical protein
MLYQQIGRPDLWSKVSFSLQMAFPPVLPQLYDASTAAGRLQDALQHRKWNRSYCQPFK